MEKDIVNKAISNPELMLSQDSKTWEELTSRYPYFAAAHLLLLKSWQRDGDYRFTDQLHQAAIHTVDRKALYQFVKSEQKQFLEPIASGSAVQVNEVSLAPVPEVVLESEVDSAPLESEDDGLAALASAIIGDEEIDVSTKTMQPSSETTPISVSQEIEAEIKVEEVEVESHDVLLSSEEEADEVEEQVGPVIHAADLDPFERNILIEAVRSSIEAEVSEHVEEEISGETLTTNPDVMPDDNDNSFAAYIMRRSRQLHFGEGKAAQPSQDELPQAGIGDWLRKEPISLESDDAAETPEEFLPRNNLSHGAKKIQVKDQKSHQKDLIDRFIRMEPQIARGKSADYTPGNIAKESLEEDFSLVTETMAKLFVSQGKIDKARKAFRKLMELYPEKSVYFAAQLKNLDKTKK